MRGLSWIKSIYAIDFQMGIPSLSSRRIAIAVSGCLSLWAWMRYSNGIPMLITLALAFAMFTEPFNKKFFYFVSVGTQILIQTLRIIIMTFFYYTVFAGCALYFRKKHLEGSSFLGYNSSSLRKMNLDNFNWKKMF